jgi:hypothetical protein
MSVLPAKPEAASARAAVAHRRPGAVIADDLAAVADIEGARVGRVARAVEQPERAAIQQEAARPAAGVVGDTDDQAAIVDHGRLRPSGHGIGARRLRECGDVAVSFAQEAVVGAVAVDVRADHLPAVVDPQDGGRRRAGDVDRRELAAVAEEAVHRALSVDVEADDLVAVVDPQRARHA